MIRLLYRHWNPRFRLWMYRQVTFAPTVYSFDMSGIPQDAQILSIAVEVA